MESGVYFHMFQMTKNVTFDGFRGRDYIQCMTKKKKLAGVHLAFSAFIIFSSTYELIKDFFMRPRNQQSGHV